MKIKRSSLLSLADKNVAQPLGGNSLMPRHPASLQHLNYSKSLWTNAVKVQGTTFKVCPVTGIAHLYRTSLGFLTDLNLWQVLKSHVVFLLTANTL